VASEPLVIIFFQFGIYVLIMVGYIDVLCPLPVWAYNIL
jgi:hypothetical protein